MICDLARIFALIFVFGPPLIAFIVCPLQIYRIGKIKDQSIQKDIDELINEATRKYEADLDRRLDALKDKP